MYYIGVDLGGTNIAIGLVDKEGKIIEQRSIPTLKERGIKLICDDMISLCQSLMDDNKLNKEDIHSIGIGTPGEIDSKNGVIVFASNIAMDNFPITETISSKLGIPTYLANDADCAALGEVTAGAGKGARNAVIVTLGTGIGGGLIVNGELYTGSYPGAGEIGHIVIDYKGRKCGCGRKGCFEQYGSATALINDAIRAAIANPTSQLNYYIKGDYDKMNAKIPFDAAKKGDRIAIEVIGQYLDYLSAGLTNIVNIFQPDTIIIGGGIAKQGDNLTIPLSNKVKKETFTKEFNTKIEVAKLGNDAGIIGAAMLGK